MEHSTALVALSNIRSNPSSIVHIHINSTMSFAGILISLSLVLRILRGEFLEAVYPAIFVNIIITRKIVKII